MKDRICKETNINIHTTIRVSSDTRIVVLVAR